MTPSSGQPVDAIPHLFELFSDFLTFLATPRGGLLLLFDMTLVAVALAVWIRDGTPGLYVLRTAAAKLTRHD